MVLDITQDDLYPLNGSPDETTEDLIGATTP